MGPPSDQSDARGSGYPFSFDAVEIKMGSDKCKIK
jgi:hypothetical protein